MYNDLIIQPEQLTHLEPRYSSVPDLAEFAAGENQESQGALINQDASGALVIQDAPGALICQGEDFELHDATAIVNFMLIPDYQDMTISAHPTVVRTPTRLVCIDGFEMVSGAMQTNQQQIRCYTISINSDDDNELAIRKASQRVLPAGGKCSYAELVRNVKIIFNLLCATTNNPVVYQHGGVRRGEKFTGNREDDVRTLLEIRLGKSRATINKYLSHGEYLTETLLQQLVENKAKKEYFETAQVNKRIRIKILEGYKLDDNKVVAPVISMEMKKWHDEYNKAGTITSIKDEPVASPVQKATPKSEEPEVFSHWQPPIMTITQEVPLDGIYEQLGAAAGALDEFIKGKPSAEAIPPFLRAHMTNVTKIIRLVEEFPQNGQVGEETDAEVEEKGDR